MTKTRIFNLFYITNDFNQFNDSNQFQITRCLNVGIRIFGGMVFDC